jgi:hypothetical protein
MPWILVKIHLSISVPNILFSFFHAEMNIARCRYPEDQIPTYKFQVKTDGETCKSHAFTCG